MGRLSDIQYQIEEATQRAHRICDGVDDRGFRRRPIPTSWSAAECIAHLSLTTNAFLPLIDRALETGTKRKVERTDGYHKDLAGWLLCWFIEPPFRMRVRTTQPFEPVNPPDKVAVLDEFDMLQSELANRIEQSVGRDLERLKVVSPFSSHVTYNLFSAFCVILAHQRRHLWQTEQILSRSQS